MANTEDKPKSDVPSVEAQAAPLVMMTAKHLEHIAISLTELGEMSGNKQLGYTAANLMAVCGGLVEYRRSDVAERLCNHIEPFIVAEEKRVAELKMGQSHIIGLLSKLMRVVAEGAGPAPSNQDKKP